MFHHLTYQKSDHIVTVEIAASLDDRMDLEVSSEFTDLCEQIAWDNDVRVVVLVCDGTGNTVMTAGHGGSVPGGPPSLVNSIAALRQPVIAAMRGDALGRGLELALACDIRMGTEGARFGLPFIREGLIPSAGGTQRLPRLVGQGKALEMILTGETIDDREALRIGLINRIVPFDELTGAATTLAGEIAERSPLAIAYVKEAFTRAWTSLWTRGCGWSSTFTCFFLPPPTGWKA